VTSVAHRRPAAARRGWRAAAFRAIATRPGRGPPLAQARTDVTPPSVPPSTVPVPAATLQGLWRDGFAVIEQLAPCEELDWIRRVMARLYRRYRGLVRVRCAWDLGASTDEGVPAILEINQTVALEPELATTVTFSRCGALAEALLGCPVEYRFDHAIYKPAFNGRATAWHQDEAYTPDPRLVTTHFWVPMQDVTLEMGCMQFIPGSHRERIRRHQRLGRQRHAHALEATDVDVARAVACPLRAGDATVHFPRTLHYTGPNLTAVPRLAWSLEFGPRRRLPSRLLARARLLWRRALRG
jgi:hypothetical protein